jgi:hypothetical protein
MASTSTEINQASSTKLSEEAKQKLLDLQTQLQEQQSNSENSNYIKFKKGCRLRFGAMSAIGLAAKAVQNAILQWRADDLKKVRQ